MAAALSATGPFGMATGSYVAERDDWRASLARARAEGWATLELTAIDSARLAELMTLLEVEADALAGFARVSVHAPVRTTETTADVVTRLSRLPFDAILHPDVYGGEPAVLTLGRKAIFENMDVVKAFGRTAGDLTEVFARFPDAGLCLDVAHVWTNDATLALGHALLDAHGARLRQVHVSGIEPDGTHRTTTAADLELFAPLLERCAGVPWLLEAVLEDGTP